MRAEQKLMDLSNRIKFYKKRENDSLTEVQQSEKLLLFPDGIETDTPTESLKNKLFGLTYNNFGCVYKQNKENSAALESLKRAMYYESLEERQSVNKGAP